MKITLELSERETVVLIGLAVRQDMTKSATMRQALRLYQYVTEKQRTGYELAFVKDGEVVRQEIVGLPLPE